MKKFLRRLLYGDESEPSAKETQAISDGVTKRIIFDCVKSARLYGYSHINVDRDISKELADELIKLGYEITRFDAYKYRVDWIEPYSKRN